MRRLILQIVGAGAGTFLLLFVLAMLGAWSVLAMLSLPVEWLVQPIAKWIDATWPPQGGGWLAGFATGIEVDAVLVWLYLWLLSIVVLRLPVSSREKKESSNET